MHFGKRTKCFQNCATNNATQVGRPGLLGCFFLFFGRNYTFTLHGDFWFCGGPIIFLYKKQKIHLFNVILPIFLNFV